MGFDSARMRFVGASAKEQVLQETQSLFVEMERVNVARGDRVVLHDVNLRIEQGEHVAVLGPNGCGKSTLMRTFSCESHPVAMTGSVRRIFGRERWDVMEMRRMLGIVPPVPPGGRAASTAGKDAVVAGFFASATLWPHFGITAEMRERADEALRRVEAAHLADKPLEEMSAGEVKRVLIARALVNRPKVLLLDEPSNALDMAAQQELRESLRKLAREGVGIVLITHHLGDIIPEIERVILMRDGRIVADDAKEKLLAPAVLEDLFGVPVGVAVRDGFYHAW